MANNVVMPHIEIKPGVEQGTIDVVLTKPSQINTGNPSAFPLVRDDFKNLNFQTGAASDLNTKLALYYEILNKIMSKTSTSADLDTLATITSQIREFVLTDEDYNLMVGALQNMQTYVLKFMYQDITNKAKAMDAEMNKVIGDINRFMEDLETTYSKSPSSYPIPDGSVLRPKLATDVKNTLAYTDSTQGVIASTSKPANPIGRPVVWFNLGTPV